MITEHPNEDTDVCKKGAIMLFESLGWPIPELEQQETSPNSKAEIRNKGPLIETQVDPKRKPFLFALAFGIFFILALIFLLINPM